MNWIISVKFSSGFRFHLLRQKNINVKKTPSKLDDSDAEPGIINQNEKSWLEESISYIYYSSISHLFERVDTKKKMHIKLTSFLVYSKNTD